MLKYGIQMFFNELKVLLLMCRRTTDPGTDPDTQTRGLAIAGRGRSQLSCSHQGDDEEEYYGSDPQPHSLAFEDRDGAKPQEGEAGEAEGGRSLDSDSLQSFSDSGTHSPQCRICFQGPEKGELLSPCRCDGSVRFIHKSCLGHWITESGSWSCELCHFKYQIHTIRFKNPLQWKTISLSVLEKLKLVNIVLSILFLLGSISWLMWSSFSLSAKWQRQTLQFQMYYGLYVLMDIMCLGLLIYHRSTIYQIFKRWRLVNQHWKVLNYEEAKDLGDLISSSNNGAQLC